MVIRELLGLNKKPKMETVEEAEEYYYECDKRSYAQGKELALIRWNELALPVVEKAASTESIEFFFEILSSIHMPYRGKAYDLAFEKFEALKSQIITTDQANSYILLPNAHQFYSSLERRWKELCLEAVSKANSFEEMKSLISDVFAKSSSREVHQAKTIKWADLSRTMSEIEEVYRYYCDSHDFYYEYEIGNYVFNRYEAIIFSEMKSDSEKLKNIRTVKCLYFNRVSDKGAAKLLLYERWLDLCKTPSEVDEAFRAAAGKSCQAMAYKRIKEFTSQTQTS